MHLLAALHHALEPPGNPLEVESVSPTWPGPQPSESPPSGAGSIQELQQLVSRQFDLLVPPRGGAVVASDQARAVQAAEDSVDERFLVLGLGWTSPQLLSSSTGAHG